MEVEIKEETIQKREQETSEEEEREHKKIKVEGNKEEKTHSKTQEEREKNEEKITQLHTKSQQPPLSKRQMKKQLKRARWLETKDERRKLKRQREKQKAKERKLRQSQQTSGNVVQSLAPVAISNETQIESTEKAVQPSLTPINSSLGSPVGLQSHNKIAESSPKSYLDPLASQNLEVISCKKIPSTTQTLEQPDRLRVAPSVPYVTPVSRRSLKKYSVKMSASPCKLRVAIDLSLEGLMDERRLGQCLRQVARCYSANRRAHAPLQLFVTSFSGRPKSVMSLQAGYENWDVNFCTNSYLDEFERSDIVYLTSESTHTLEKLDHSKVYIIGGLVDHNKLKGHCLRLASDRNLSTAKLPINQYLDLSTRHVLTIDQVFRILLGVAGGDGWKDVLISVLPPRKGAKEKEVKENGDDDENGEIVKMEEEKKHDGNSCKNNVMEEENK